MAVKFAESLYLEGIIESVNADLLSVREQMLKHNPTGLGPPDLVLLTKKTNNPQFPIVKSFHYISGFTISGPSSFPAYFASLCQLIPKTVLGVPKYSLIEGVLFCWNSFSNVDIHITVNNTGSVSLDYEPENLEYRISELTWRELSICTTLRFWRASDPIFSMLFGFNAITAPVMRQIIPQQLSPDDIRFAVAAHHFSSDLNYSIANAIIAMKNRTQAMELIHELLPLAPRIIEALLKFIPVSSPTFPELKNLIIDGYNVAPDDVILGVMLVNTCLATNDLTKCSLATPLLLASIWSEPLAAIALSQICRVENHPEDALFFLNAACLSREPAWNSTVMTFSRSTTTKQKHSFKTEISEIEQYLCCSHLCGVGFYFHRAIAELTRDLGPIKLQTMLKYKSFTAKSIIPHIPELTYFKQNSIEESAAPLLIHSEEAKYLYDPGITAQPSPPKIIERLPTTQKLIDVAEYVLRDMSYCDSVRRNNQFQNDFEAMKTCIIGLRVGDMDVVNLALKAIKNPSLFSDLLTMRYLCETQWTSLSGIFHEPTKTTTINEANSVFFAKAIAVALESFIV